MDIIERIKSKLDTLPKGYDVGDIGDIIGRSIMEDLLESQSAKETITDSVESFISGLNHGLRFYDYQL